MISLLLISCNSQTEDHIRLHPYLDIPRIETLPSDTVEDIESPDKNFRVIILLENFPHQDTKIDKQKEVLEYYVEALKQTEWQFASRELHSTGTQQFVFYYKTDDRYCPASLSVRHLDYYKEIGDVYFGIESHNKIEFVLSEDRTNQCQSRLPSNNLSSEYN